MKTPFLYNYTIIVTLVFFVLSSLLFQNKLYAQEENNNQSEQIPRFPGCEDMVSISEKNECAEKKLLEYVYSNLNYPAEARKKRIEGRVILRFTVTKYGNIENVEVLSDIGGGCGEEAKRVIESMNNLTQKWTPGRQGRNVNVCYTLPIVFKLDAVLDRKKLPESKITYFKLDNDTVLLKNEQLPMFPGAKIKAEYIKYYNNFKLQEYVNSNLRFPDEVFQRNLSDEVLVQFMISKKGEIKDIKVIKDFGYGSGDEAVRLMSILSKRTEKWKPASIDGKNVDTYLKYRMKFPNPDERIKMINESSNVEVFSICEDMPQFAGCSDFKNQYEKENCSKQRLKDYLQSKVIYPYEAKRMDLEGKVAVRFIVYADGKVGNIEILNDIGGGCGDEAKRVIESMNSLPQAWIPGKQGGRKVNTFIKTSIDFKL